MPSYLDLAVLGIVLFSALLAMLRGFTREVLAIAAWVGAAAVAYIEFKSPHFMGFIKPYISKDVIAQVVDAAAVFFAALFLITIVTVKLSDVILDSKIGALDRTLGFLFGLARGLLIIVVAFQFFAWLVPEKQQPDWVRSAKSRVVLQGTGEWLMSLLPDDPENTILKKFKKPKADEEQTDMAPDPRSSGASDGGYAKSARDGLKQLIDGKASNR